MVCWMCTAKSVALVYTELTYNEDSRGRPPPRRGEGVASAIDRGSGEVSVAKRGTLWAWPSPVLGEFPSCGAQFSSDRSSGRAVTVASRARSNCLWRCIGGLGSARRGEESIKRSPTFVRGVETAAVAGRGVYERLPAARQEEQHRLQSDGPPYVVHVHCMVWRRVVNDALP